MRVFYTVFKQYMDEDESVSINLKVLDTGKSILYFSEPLEEHKALSIIANDFILL
jgi:hypothetical protein